MSKYAIRIQDGNLTDFIGNGSYIFQQEKYAVLADRIDEAKRYTTKERAENAYKKLLLSCCNLTGKCEIVEVEE